MGCLASVLVDEMFVDEINSKATIINCQEKVRSAEELPKGQETKIFGLVEIPSSHQVFNLEEKTQRRSKIEDLPKQIVRIRGQKGTSR